MTKFILVLALATFGFAATAEESMGEKAKATGNDMKRGAKKAGNRVKEAVCAESDAECLAKKAGNRVKEGGEHVGDKAKEVKDKAD